MSPEIKLNQMREQWRLKYGWDKDFAPTHWVMSFDWFMRMKASISQEHLCVLLDINGAPIFGDLPIILDGRFSEPQLARLDPL